MIIELTEKNFKEETGKSEPILVDFWATWCAPCMMQGKILHALDEKHPSLRIGKVNVDECQDLAVQYDIEAIPTMVLFKDGKAAEQVVGMRQEDDILDMFRKHGADV